MNPIYMGTILLEPNRWGSRQPSYAVSEWLGRFRSDGFDGIELWENHALLGGEEEQERLAANDTGIDIYNSYVNFDEESADRRKAAADMIHSLRARGVKYNFGNQASALETYMKNLREWAEWLPAECRLLCECHPGTIMEDPAVAEQVLRELADPRFQAIVHFPHQPAKLDEWFSRLGERITHVHVQQRSPNNVCIRLQSNPEQSHKSGEVLSRYAYKGSFTIEFTEGVRGHEQIEGLYQAAVDDLHFLRGVMQGW